MAEAEGPSLAVSAFLERWARRLAILGFCALGLVALLTTWDGVARYLGWPRLSGYADILSIAFAIVVATCFPLGLLTRTNITVRLLGKATGRRGDAFLEAVGASVSLLFFAILFWRFVVFAGELGAAGRTTSTIELPLAPWWWLITAIIAVTLPVQLWVSWRCWRAAVTGEPSCLPETD